MAPAKPQGPELGPRAPTEEILASLVEAWPLPEAFNLESDLR